MKTTYEHKVAFTLLGGFCLPSGIEPLDLFSSKNLTVQLLSNESEFCMENDISSAIGMVYLNKFHHNSTEKLSRELINQELENITKSRHEKFKNSNILAIKVNKTCNIEITDVVYNDESIIVSVSENNNDELIKDNAKEIDNVICAIRTNSLNTIEFEKISEGIYFPEIDGKILFRKKVSLIRSNIFCATSFTQTYVNQVTASIKYFSQHENLTKIQSLFNQMHDKKNDELKSAYSCDYGHHS